MKKSQISMFIILGIILLIIVSFAVYIINYSVKKQAQREIKTTQKQSSRTDAIENYITTCLEKTTKKGLKLMGDQGGVIYKDQGGLTEATPEDYLLKDNVKIWYEIKEPSTATCRQGDSCLADCIVPDPDCNNNLCGNDGFCVIGCNNVDIDCGRQGSTCSQGDGCKAGCTSVDPDCGGATCSQGDSCISNCNPPDPDCSIYTCDEDGMCALGCYPIDPDCAKNDNNGFTITAPLYPWKCFPKSTGCYLPKRYTGYFGASLLPPLEGINSVKNQLKAFIKNDVTNCIDLAMFEEQGFDISAGAIETDITLAEKNTIVNLNYPLNIKHYRTGEKAKLNDFSYSIGVNLRGIHNYTDEIITKDTTNVKYTPGSKDYYSVGIERLTDKDIITVTDSSSIIDGRPYTFRFARKNRRPALEMLSSITIAVDEYVDVLFNKIIGTASVKIHDPDEDLDCSSFTIFDCEDKCLLADCNQGSIKLECPTILDFKNKKKIGGPVTQNKPNQEPEKCKVAISDDIFEDYQEDVEIQITPASD